MPIIVPLRLTGGRVLLDVSLNGQPALPFLLDTGGIVSLIRHDAARGRLGVDRHAAAEFGWWLRRSDPRAGYEAREIVISGVARRGPVQFAGVDPHQIGLGASGSLDGEVLTAYPSLLSFGELRWSIFNGGKPDHVGFTRVSSSISQPARHGSPFL